MGELIALEVGPCAALDAFWTDGAVDAAQDPFRRRGDGRKRRLVFDARRGAVVASAAPAWDAEAPPAVAAAARAPFDGALVPLPLWGGAEALSGFGGFFAGCRDGGGLGAAWWDDACDRLRRELEACDRVSGCVVACCVEFNHWFGWS